MTDELTNLPTRCVFMTIATARLVNLRRTPRGGSARVRRFGSRAADVLAARRGGLGC